MMANYLVTRESEFGVELVRDDGAKALAITPDKSQTIWNHSPDGFECGYAGSGPAQLALAILVDYFERHSIAPKLATQYHQDFKFKFISPMNKNGGEISDQQIEFFLAEKNCDLSQKDLKL